MQTSKRTLAVFSYFDKSSHYRQHFWSPNKHKRKLLAIIEMKVVNWRDCCHSLTQLVFTWQVWKIFVSTFKLTGSGLETSWSSSLLSFLPFLSLHLSYSLVRTCKQNLCMMKTPLQHMTDSHWLLWSPRLTLSRRVIARKCFLYCAKSKGGQ